MTKRKDLTPSTLEDPKEVAEPVPRFSGDRPPPPQDSSLAAAQPPASRKNKNNTDNDNADVSLLQILVSRIPRTWDETIVQRLLEERLGAGPGSVQRVVLAYEPVQPSSLTEESTSTTTTRPPLPKAPGDRFYRPHQDKTKRPPPQESSTHTTTATVEGDAASQPQQPHRGFGFATLSSVEWVQHALTQVQTIRGGAKPTSTRKYTLYLGPVSPQSNTNNDDSHCDKKKQPSPSSVCFLFAKRGQCPYGDACKFTHDQSRRASTNTVISTTTADSTSNSSQGTASQEPTPTTRIAKSDAEKDCIHWKTRGRCRRLDKTMCPYRHDPMVQQKALAKRQRKNNNNNKLLVPSNQPFEEKGNDVECAKIKRQRT